MSGWFKQHTHLHRDKACYWSYRTVVGPNARLTEKRDLPSASEETAMASTSAFLPPLLVGHNHQKVLLQRPQCGLSTLQAARGRRTHGGISPLTGDKVEITAKIFDWKKREDPDYGKSMFLCFMRGGGEGEVGGGWDCIGWV